jgi:hypothetical protein
MKSLVRSLGIAGTVLMLASVQNASAQVVDAIEFTTAFPFTVGNSMVPAGRYTITPDDDNPAILELTGGRAAVLFETRSAEAPKTPSKTEVVFKRYGDGYVLKDIWIDGENTGAETLAAEGERHHMKKHPGAAAEQRVAGTKKGRASTPSSTSTQR